MEQTKRPPPTAAALQFAAPQGCPGCGGSRMPWHCAQLADANPAGVRHFLMMQDYQADAEEATASSVFLQSRD